MRVRLQGPHLPNVKAHSDLLDSLLPGTMGCLSKCLGRAESPAKTLDTERYGPQLGVRMQNGEAGLLRRILHPPLCNPVRLLVFVAAMGFTTAAVGLAAATVRGATAGLDTAAATGSATMILTAAATTRFRTVGRAVP